MFTGRTFILLITNEIDKNAIIKKDKKTIPKDFKLDFKFKICLVDIIKPAKIQNCVKKIIGIIKSGVIAKNHESLGLAALWISITVGRLGEHFLDVQENVYKIDAESLLSHESISLLLPTGGLWDQINIGSKSALYNHVS